MHKVAFECVKALNAEPIMFQIIKEINKIIIYKPLKILIMMYVATWFSKIYLKVIKE